jgi:hypothetical protein
MSQQGTHRLGVEMHGVRLNLTSTYGTLAEHLAGLLDGDVRPVWDRPDFDVSVVWRTAADAVETAPAGQELDGFGKRMRLSENDLVWFDTHRDKDLQLRFRRDGDRFVFDVEYCYRPSAKKLARYPDYEQRKFFSLMRYLVHFPIAWHLERTRGWCLIHASAVARDGRAILVAGPGGAGKTTTCVALVARAGMTLVTENLLFSDGEHVFPLNEPIRLTDESLALLGQEAGTLDPLDLIGGLKHKSLFRLPVFSDADPVRPAALFIPQFARAGFARRIPSGIASELLGATNRLTLELNDYYWYTAALDLLWPSAGNADRQLRVLQRLTATTPCYALGIDRSGGVEPVVARILDSVESSRRAMGKAAS